MPKGNEIEAMRHWRGALDQIYDHNANKALPLYTARTDTEKALIDALKQLELQCKERIDLLEALRVSRQDSPTTTTSTTAAASSSGKLSKSVEIPDSGAGSKGSIGQGTIPAVTYSELSRPSVPNRPINQRPSLPPRPSSDALLPGSPSSIRNTNSSNNLAATSASIHRTTSNGKSPDTSSPVRSPSPDKYTMRTTLRSGKQGEKSSKPRKSPKPAAEGPSKAATLAWSSLSSRERIARSTPQDKSATVSQRHSSEQPRQSGPAYIHWDSHSRRLVNPRATDSSTNGFDNGAIARHSDEYLRPSQLSVSAASSALNYPPVQDSSSSDQGASRLDRSNAGRTAPPRSSSKTPHTDQAITGSTSELPERRRTPATPTRKKVSSGRLSTNNQLPANPPSQANRPRRRDRPLQLSSQAVVRSSDSDDDNLKPTPRSKPKKQKPSEEITEDTGARSSTDSPVEEAASEDSSWKKRKAAILKNLPPGIDESAAKQILNDIVVQGDEVRWSDVAGLDIAKNALREAVVYPFLRPDLFMGLREPARGMLLFGPPGTGKTMLARAVATESMSTFFSISASSLTSKFLGESEKLVRALFGLAKVLAPSIIFVDEIDSLLSQRSGSGEHEATRRIKTEFLIQWSDLQRAAAGRETTEKDKERGDANRVLVLAATNLPWAIDEAARRRFVRRQYIPLPEPTTRETQIRTLLGQQKHHLSDADIGQLVELTDGKEME